MKALNEEISFVLKSVCGGWRLRKSRFFSICKHNAKNEVVKYAVKRIQLPAELKSIQLSSFDNNTIL